MVGVLPCFETIWMSIMAEAAASMQAARLAAVQVGRSGLNAVSFGQATTPCKGSRRSRMELFDLV
jgi:hypothetical protein